MRDVKLFNDIIGDLMNVLKRLFDGVIFFEPKIQPVYTFGLYPGYLPSLPKLLFYSCFMFLALSVFLSFVSNFSKNSIDLSKFSKKEKKGGKK